MATIKYVNLTSEETNKLRDNVYKISDAFYALRDLQRESSIPDLDRLVSDLRDMVDGPLALYTKSL